MNLQRQRQTPLLDALLEYAHNHTVPFHVPGHKQGNAMHPLFRQCAGELLLSMDVTLFQQVDSLHHPTGAIREAQELAAEAFFADQTFFCVHGTSGAIQAMILSVVGESDKILLPRNVHKSITSSLILSGAVPVYMKPEIHLQTGTALNITPETVEESLRLHPDVKAVLLINPTYYGVAADLERIVRLVHRRDIPLIVDEAHGPHLCFHPHLPLSAMEAGADACAQSTHKILGSLTQSSMLHVRGTRIDAQRVRSMMNLLQTTSPSYPLLASLDVARMQMATQGTELLEGTSQLADDARKAIRTIPGFTCMGDEVVGNPGAYGFDPGKVTITCREMGMSGHALERTLAETYRIQPEMADLYNVLCTLSIGTTPEHVEKLIDALGHISRQVNAANVVPYPAPVFTSLPEIPDMALTPREAFHAPSRSLPLEESVGEISTEFLLAYPPGIPLLCPGERITQDILDAVEAQKSAGLSVQGTRDPHVTHIQVASDALHGTVESRHIS